MRSSSFCSLRQWVIYALTAVLAVGFWYCAVYPNSLQMPRLIFINMSSSLPLGIYIAIPGRHFRDGDIVAYVPMESVDELVHKRGWEDIGSHVFLKKAYGPNTVYSVQPGGETSSFVVNHQACGAVFESDGDGRPLPQHYGSYIVQRYQFLPVGTSLHSFDGRYTGTVPQSQIICRVVPLITH